MEQTDGAAEESGVLLVDDAAADDGGDLAAAHAAYRAAALRAASSSRVHLLDDIHKVIVLYQLGVIFGVVVTGLAIVPILRGPYFSFGAPVALADGAVVTSNITLGVAILFLALARVVEVVAGEMRAWGAVFDPDTPEDARTRYVRNMLGALARVVLFWLNMQTSILFLRAQVSAAVGLFVADVLAYGAAKQLSVRLHAALFDGPKPSDVARRRAAGVFRALTLGALALQILCVPLFWCLYEITGLTQSAYFHVGAPLAVFGNVVTGTAAYAYIFAACFLVTLNSAFFDCVVADWHTSYLQNPAVGHEELLLTRAEARGMFTMQRLVRWLRQIFVYQFLVAQFPFVLAYMAAEAVAALVTTHYGLLARADPQARWRWRTATRDLVVWLSYAQAAEALVIVLVVVLPQYANNAYFSWVRAADLFGNTIVHSNQIAIIFVLLALTRLSATLYSDIIVPDYTNWLYADSQLLKYSHAAHLFILGATRVDYLLRFLLLIQFVLANVYFVVVAAAVDIVVGLLVVNRYLQHKDALRSVGDAIDLLLVEKAHIDLAWSGARAPPAAPAAKGSARPRRPVDPKLHKFRWGL